MNLFSNHVYLRYIDEFHVYQQLSAKELRHLEHSQLTFVLLPETTYFISLVNLQSLNNVTCSHLQRPLLRVVSVRDRDKKEL